MEVKKLQKLSLAALTVSLLPFLTLVPVYDCGVPLGRNPAL